MIELVEHPRRSRASGQDRRGRHGRWRWFVVVSALLPLAALPACMARLVALETVAPSVRQDIRYAGHENFVGAPIEGYRAARCWLSEPAARALAQVQQDIAGDGLTLIIFDCYRPKRAVAHFVRWAKDGRDQRTKEEYYPRVSKEDLFVQGYVAERSGHSRGSTVDVTLARLCGTHTVPLDMGTRFDFFDPRSRLSSPEVTAEQQANRGRLRAAMQRRGFLPYEPEWWHFTLADEPYPKRYFDVPIE